MAYEVPGTSFAFGTGLKKNPGLSQVQKRERRTLRPKQEAISHRARNPASNTTNEFLAQFVNGVCEWSCVLLEACPFRPSGTAL